MKNLTSSMLVAAVLLLSSLTSIQALSLPQIFSEAMVFQREAPVAVWGQADPGQQVTVAFGGQTKSAQTAEDGTWRVTLEAMPASAEPRLLEVSTGETQLTFANVLVGEVWLCSGQSNMEWLVSNSSDADQTITNARNQLIRQFTVAPATAITPQKDVLRGNWSVCSSASVGSFSGVAYFFALNLFKELNVPIGVINSSWGGTRIEPWTDLEGFSVSPMLKEIADNVTGLNAAYRETQLSMLDAYDAWLKAAHAAKDSGAVIPELPAMPAHPLMDRNQPTSIYNAMIAPLVGYGIRGALWYQGESNNGEGMLYCEKMKALITAWRRLWNQGDFPFYYVQLAPYKYDKPEDLPGIWEAQFKALSIPKTGMAVTVDIATPTNIHPPNKKDVGHRLALWALAKDYGVKGLEYSGPLYKSMKVDGNKIVIQFDHAEGLKSRDGKDLTWFTIAGEDKNFVDAKAEIKGKTIVVSSDAVAKPVAVRFGWNEIAEPNLNNGADLPASPFRTDSWGSD